MGKSRISENIKVDVAVSPVQATSSLTSKYFKLDKYDRALFVVNWSPVGASAIVTTSILTLYQAKDASAATSAAAITSSTAICTTGAKITEFTITPATVSADDTVAITGYDSNGDALTALTFTAEDGGTSAHTASTSRYFSINDTAAGTGIVSEVCTHLATLINDTTYGLPNAYASAASTSVTIVSMNPGANCFTVTSSSTANFALAATKCIAMVEVKASALTLSSDFTHVAVNVAHEISAWTSAICIRSGCKKLMPIQMAGAITTVGY